MNAIASGLIGGAIAFAAILFAEYRQSPAKRDGRGWTVLRAGWLLRFTMIGYAAIAAFLLYFLVAGGSARPDAELQNGYALALLFITAGIGAYTAWTGYGRSIRWRNDVLLIRSIGARETSQRLSNIVQVRHDDLRGAYRLSFRDGSGIWISAYLRGAGELVSMAPVDRIR